MREYGSNINLPSLDNLFSSEQERQEAKFDINVNVQGGGFMGQAEAVRTSIAKGLVEFLQDAELEASFKQYDRSLLISDPRRKLPKKPQGRGARKKRQKSYR